MFVADICFYGPRLIHHPNSLTSNGEFRIRFFIGNRVSTKSTFSPQFVPKKRKFVCSVVPVRSMDGGEWEDNGKGEAEASAALEQEEQSPLFGGSAALPNALHSTINRLSKWIVAALFTAIVLGRHDAEALWATMGSVLNSAFSVVLKRILNQERPSSDISSGPGMPSSHAQSIFYTVVFVIWSLIEWRGGNYVAWILSTMVLACGSYFSWLRVSQRYHSISQVAVGAAVGSAFGILWLWSWHAFVATLFISSLWFKVVVFVASTILCLCFLVHVVRHWFRDVQ